MFGNELRASAAPRLRPAGPDGPNLQAGTSIYHAHRLLAVFAFVSAMLK